MGGLYGNMLSYFTGQFRSFTYYNMIPLVNSGYVLDTTFPVQTLRGVLQTSETSAAEQNNALVRKSNEYLWTESSLQVGFWVNFDGTTYKIIPSNDWVFEGGFNRYTIERVIGDNGTPDTGDYTAGLGGTPI